MDGVGHLEEELSERRADAKLGKEPHLESNAYILVLGGVDPATEEGTNLAPALTWGCLYPALHFRVAVS